MGIVDKPILERGIQFDVSQLTPPQTVTLFGHVILIEGYALTTYTGCHAVVTLRDTPGKTVVVLTVELRLQSLLETALETGNLIAFRGRKLVSPPTPGGGTWSVDVYDIDGVILYNMP
ncbi:MAG: hypothetical protein KC423_20140 [Anaerolineales bacterium]|nr:hypothetical protein [Anaerolineales bacterium]